MSFLSNGFGWLLGNNESSATGTVTSIATAGLISGGIITVSGTITTSVSTNKLVGRGTSGTGVMEEITLGTNLSLSGTTLNASGGGGGVTSVTGTTPIASSGGTTPTISISQATTSTNGYLSSIDWNTFNNKGSGTVTSVGGTLPISSSGGATPTISISQSSGATNGYLSSTDWTTFNNKGSGTITSVTGTTPIASSGGATPDISISQATTSTNGYLSSTDWNTFNNKGSGTVTSVSALTLGTTGTDLSSTVANGTTTPVITLNVPTASASNRGALSSTDWTTFNNKGSGTVTSVGGTLPISSSGGATPTISITQSSGATNGYLSSTDWTTFNNKQNTITLTTTGTSGASTLIGATLNIPNYGSALTGYVPYVGATQDLDLGAFKLNAQSLHAKGTGGLGHLGLKHQSASATASANEVSLFADSLGDLSWLNGNLYLSKFITSSNTTNRSYTFPNNTGTIALTSDLTVFVTSVTSTSPISSSGGATPDISISQATTSTNGYLSSIDWNTFNNKGSGTVTSVSGTLNRITSSGGTTPIIDISTSYVGQTSITTLGTIGTGVWNGTTIAIANGGTGQITNTLGFDALSPTTTRGDTIVRGVTNNVRLALGTVGKILRSDGTDLVYTTATYPTTTAISTLLYSSAANVISALATANNGILVTSATGVPSISAQLTYVAVTGVLTNTLSANASIQIAVVNTSSGAATVSQFTANNGTYNFALQQLGTGYTTNGLLVANQSRLASSSIASMLINTSAASVPIIFAVGGYAATNEVHRSTTSGIEFRVLLTTVVHSAANLMAGQITLIGGTLAVTITGLTTSHRGMVTLVTPNNVLNTRSYQAVCTANTITIRANTDTGLLNPIDTSVLNYFIFLNN